MEKTETSLLKSFGMLAFSICNLFVTFFSYGWMGAKVWNWFMPAIFGIHALTHAQALGLSTVVGALTLGPFATIIFRISNKETETYDKKLLYGIAHSLIIPPLFVLNAWIIHSLFF